MIVARIVERTIRFSHLTGSIEREREKKFSNRFCFFSQRVDLQLVKIEYRPVITMVQRFI